MASARNIPSPRCRANWRPSFEKPLRFSSTTRNRNDVREVEQRTAETEPDGVEVLVANPDIARIQSALQLDEAKGTESDDAARRAAVALIFRAAARDRKPELLFIKRAEYPGDPWSGQVAFPGGREEAGDASLVHTAIRETREETGLDLQRDATIIGRLDDLRPQTVRLPAIIVRPYVALLRRTEEMLLSDEVALAFWVPFDALKESDSWRETQVFARGIQFNRRAFHHEGHVIWGMTERILGQLLAIVQ
jgi:8-oxo-dGTP pyrophosphatase MutT (NUDIX family)